MSMESAQDQYEVSLNFYIIEISEATNVKD